MTCTAAPRDLRSSPSSSPLLILFPSLFSMLFPLLSLLSYSIKAKNTVTRMNELTKHYTNMQMGVYSWIIILN